LGLTKRGKVRIQPAEIKLVKSIEENTKLQHPYIMMLLIAREDFIAFRCTEY
jgi:hypothetical protein